MVKFPVIFPSFTKLCRLSVWMSDFFMKYDITELLRGLLQIALKWDLDEV